MKDENTSPPFAMAYFFGRKARQRPMSVAEVRGEGNISFNE
jgi:hypothetical protein